MQGGQGEGVDQNVKEVAKTAAKGVATAYGGAAGGAAVDALSKTKLGNAALDAVSNKAGKMPGIKGASEKLNKSGALDIANKAIDAKGKKAGGGDIPEGLKKKGPQMNANSGAKNAGAKKGTGEGLDKKEGLEEKDGLKKKEKKSKDTDKGSSGESSKSTSSGLGDYEEGEKKKRKFLIHVALFFIGLFASICSFIIAIMLPVLLIDTLITSLVSHFGIKERTGESVSSNVEGLFSEDKYFKSEDGEVYGLNGYTETDENGENPVEKKGLLQVLEEEDACKLNDKWYEFIDNIEAFFSGGKFNPNVPCSVLRYINNLSETYETKYSNYGLLIDRSSIYSTIFYGYDQQARDALKIEAGEEVTDDNSFVSASDHFVMLANLVSGEEPKLDRSSIERLVRNSLFEDYWRYFTFTVTDEYYNGGYDTNPDDPGEYRPTKKEITARINANVSAEEIRTTPEVKMKNGVEQQLTESEKKTRKYDIIQQRIDDYINNVISQYFVNTMASTIVGKNQKNDDEIAAIISNGGLVNFNIPFYIGHCTGDNHSYIYYSKEKYDIFLRYDEYYNTDNKDTPGTFSSGGYVASGDKYAIDRKIEGNFDHEKMYGAGWTYDTDMNNSWINSDLPCSNTMSMNDVRYEYFVDYMKGYVKATNFYIKRGIGRKGGITPEVTVVQNLPYFQKIPASELQTTTKDVFAPSTRLYTTNGIVTDIKNVEFSYNKGYAYLQFPGYHDSEHLFGYAYNEITSPKKVETTIQNIKLRQADFTELLNPILKTEEEVMAGIPAGGSLNLEKYCDLVIKHGVGAFELQIDDCQDNYITTRSFKDYIIGVTYAEIGVTGDEEIVKTQMVAAISYTLGRHANYRNINRFRMKSGSCDQNYCDPYIGCSRSEVGSYTSKKGTLMLPTYPGIINSATTTGSCYYNGVLVESKYWKCPLTKTEMEKASKLFEEAVQYVVYSESDGFHGAYVQSVQLGWSSGGSSFVDKLASTYGGQDVYDCKQVILDSPNITDKVRKKGEDLQAVLNASGNGAACAKKQHLDDTSDSQGIKEDVVSHAFSYFGLTDAQYGRKKGRSYTSETLWCARFVSDMFSETPGAPATISTSSVSSYATSCFNQGIYYHSENCCSGGGGCQSIRGKQVQSIADVGGPKRNDVIIFVTCQNGKSGYNCDLKFPESVAESGGTTGRHIGIVVKSDATNVYYIHGNAGNDSSSSVRYTTIPRTDGYIAGYCRYDDYSAETNSSGGEGNLDE